MTPDFPDRDSDAVGTPATRQDTGERLAQDFEAVSETARRDLGAVASEMRGNADELKEAVGEQVHAAGEKARSFASEQKDFAADQLDGISAAVSRVAEELSSGEQAAIGRHARDIAGGVDRLARTIRDNEVDELLSMAQSFGRTQPIAFLGAAAAAGFMASRFALASAHRRAGQQQRQAASTPSNTTQPAGTPQASTYGGSNGR